MLLDAHFERLGALIGEDKRSFGIVNKLLSVLFLSDEVRGGLIVALLLNQELGLVLRFLGLKFTKLASLKSYSPESWSTATAVLLPKVLRVRVLKDLCHVFVYNMCAMFHDMFIIVQY